MSEEMLKPPTGGPENWGNWIEELTKQHTEERLLQVLLVDEKTRETVRVTIGKEGKGAITGCEDLLNWFGKQVPEFDGLLTGDTTLPEGRHVYMRERDADGDDDSVRRRFRLSLPTSPTAPVDSG